MTKRRALHLVMYIMRKMRDPYYAGAPAELAFFFLLSMVPLTIVLGELLGIFSISMNWIYAILMQYVSGDVAAALRPYLNYHPSTSMNAAFLILAVWASSRGQYSLIRISNYAYEHGGISYSYFHERIRAIKTVILTLFMIAFSLIILIYGESILKVVAIYFNQTFSIAFTVRSTWLLLRWPFALTEYFMIISYTYLVLPAEKLTFKKVIPGSVFSSLMILISSIIYSNYAVGFKGTGVLYGSLTSIISLLFWFYIIGYILVIGIQLNIGWQEVKD